MTDDLLRFRLLWGLQEMTRRRCHAEKYSPDMLCFKIYTRRRPQLSEYFLFNKKKDHRSIGIRHLHVLITWNGILLD